MQKTINRIKNRLQNINSIIVCFAYLSILLVNSCNLFNYILLLLFISLYTSSRLLQFLWLYTLPPSLNSNMSILIVSLYSWLLCYLMCLTSFFIPKIAIGQSQKRMLSPTYSPHTPATPSKKSPIFPPTTLSKQRLNTFINRVLKSSLHPYPVISSSAL